MKLSCATALVLAATIGPSHVLAAGSGRVASSSDPAVVQYNKGVRLTMKKKFAKAEKRYRKALAGKEDFAEAHNNLAYVLRKQGPEYYEEALAHYDLAIELKPSMPEPYMYRGVLHVKMGHTVLAEEDYVTLRKLSPRLAEELAYVIKNKREKEPEQFFGVTGKLDK